MIESAEIVRDTFIELGLSDAELGEVAGIIAETKPPGMPEQVADDLAPLVRALLLIALRPAAEAVIAARGD